MDKQPQILKLVKLIKIHCKLNEPTCNSNIYKQDPFINFEILRLNYFNVLLQVSFFFFKRKKKSYSLLECAYYCSSYELC